MIKPTKLQGLYEGAGRQRRLYTLSIAPGKSVYGEFVYRDNGEEYREWDPESSKICSALHKGLSQLGFKPGDYVLYLGCASGTTVSHVSDIVGPKGAVYAVDMAPRVLRDMVFVAEDRPNIAPILADANDYRSLAKQVTQADFLFQDIATKDQLGIFLQSVGMFLKSGGFAMLAVKARSIDVTKRPKDIFAQVRKELEKTLVIVDYRELDPFQKDHCLFMVKKK